MNLKFNTSGCLRLTWDPVDSADYYIVECGNHVIRTKEPSVVLENCESNDEVSVSVINECGQRSSPSIEQMSGKYMSFLICRC